jgi:hypothetical protein
LRLALARLGGGLLLDDNDLGSGFCGGGFCFGRGERCGLCLCLGGGFGFCLGGRFGLCRCGGLGLCARGGFCFGCGCGCGLRFGACGRFGFCGCGGFRLCARGRLGVCGRLCGGCGFGLGGSSGCGGFGLGLRCGGLGSGGFGGACGRFCFGNGGGCSSLRRGGFGSGGCGLALGPCRIGRHAGRKLSGDHPAAADLLGGKGCADLQPYDMEVGAGTFHPATTLRALGAKPWAAAYVQPSRRPTDGRYGENPNRLQHYYQYQVLIKPSPPDLQDLYLGSLEAIGIDMDIHDIRFVEDDWESPTLGAWGLGWEVWCDGMEVSQFTYFQQVGGHDCHPSRAS